MFTGIVEAIGTLRQRSGRPVAKARIDGPLGGLVLGESISVNGACLTVSSVVPTGFECDLGPETLATTTLADLPLGSPVHLERAVQMGGRFGGHFVLGHVDSVGAVVQNEPRGDARYFRVRCPVRLASFFAEKGSVAIDGVSLTINTVSRAQAGAILFDVLLVPHTVATTRLGELSHGAYVNVEVDVLARYVAQKLANRGQPPEEPPESDPDESRLLGKLAAGGYI